MRYFYDGYIDYNLRWAKQKCNLPLLRNSIPFKKEEKKKCIDMISYTKNKLIYRSYCSQTKKVKTDEIKQFITKTDNH